MSTPWIPLVATDPCAPDAGIRPVTFEEAQPWCNFPVLAPAELPHGLRISEVLLRPEARPGPRGGGSPDWTAANRSSVRVIISDDRCRIRLKQFLYDWAPPAFDHPALWRCDARPVPAGRNIAWIGRDYLGHAAASLITGRTTVELSVTEGTAGEDLAGILGGLSAVCADSLKAIEETPFSALAYGRRHEERSVEVPTGYVRHRREPAGAPVVWLLPEEIPDDLPGAVVARSLPGGFQIDGAAVLGERSRPREVDWVFRTADDAGPRLRLLVLPTEGPWPAVLDEQPCRSRTVRTAGGEWLHAYGTEEYGPHEAVGRSGGQVRILLAKPGPRTDLGWFSALLDGIVPAS